MPATGTAEKRVFLPLGILGHCQSLSNYDISEGRGEMGLHRFAKGSVKYIRWSVTT